MSYYDTQRYGYNPYAPSKEERELDGVGGILPFVYLIIVAIVILLCIAIASILIIGVACVLAVIGYFMFKCWFDILNNAIKDIKKFVLGLKGRNNSDQLVTYP